MLKFGKFIKESLGQQLGICSDVKHTGAIILQNMSQNNSQTYVHSKNETRFCKTMNFLITGSMPMAFSNSNDKNQKNTKRFKAQAIKYKIN